MARNNMRLNLRCRRLRVETLECRRVLAGIVSGAFEEVLITRHDSHGDRPNNDRPAIEGQVEQGRGAQESRSRSSAENAHSRGPWSLSADRTREDRDEGNGEGEPVAPVPPTSIPIAVSGNSEQISPSSDPSGSASGESQNSIAARLTPNGSLNLNPPVSNPGSTNGRPTASQTAPSNPPAAATVRTFLQPPVDGDSNANEVMFDLGAIIAPDGQDAGNSLLGSSLTSELKQVHSSDRSPLSNLREERFIALESLFAESNGFELGRANRADDSIDSLLRELLPANALQQSNDADRAENEQNRVLRGRSQSEPTRVDSLRGRFDNVGENKLASQLGHTDGMIAIRIPISVLPTGTAEDDASNSMAWSLPLGASHDSLELLAVSGQATTTGANSLNSKDSDRKEKSISALQPVLAATTAALGVLYVGRRRQQRADEQERKQFEQLN